MRTPRPWLLAFRLALAAFVVAGATGVLLRGAPWLGLPAGLEPTGLRHAHSHLMFMGWATPALMALWLATLPTRRRPGRGAALAVGASLVLAMLAWGAFLRWGYGVVAIGGAVLPPAAVLSGLAVLAWYGFAAAWWWSARGVRRTLAHRLADVALLLMLLSTAGVWGETLLVAGGVHDPFWRAAMVHLFLDLFGDGWFLCGLLALLCWHLPPARPRAAGAAAAVLVTALPFAVLLQLPDDDLAPALTLAGHGAALLAGVALLALTTMLWRAAPGRDPAWRAPLVLLGLKGLTLVAAAHPPLLGAAEGAGLRIPVLHLTYLGAVTLGLLAAARARWGAARVPLLAPMTAAVALMLLSLLPLTGWWPLAWAGPWTGKAAALTAALTTASALAVLLGGLGTEVEEAAGAAAGELT